MKTVFADTGYWVALLNPKDQWHDKAILTSKNLGKVRQLTTEMVLSGLMRLMSIS